MAFPEQRALDGCINPRLINRYVDFDPKLDSSSDTCFSESATDADLDAANSSTLEVESTAIVLIKFKGGQHREWTSPSQSNSEIFQADEPDGFATPIVTIEESLNDGLQLPGLDTERPNLGAVDTWAISRWISPLEYPSGFSQPEELQLADSTLNGAASSEAWVEEALGNIFHVPCPNSKPSNPERANAWAQPYSAIGFEDIVEYTDEPMLEQADLVRVQNVEAVQTLPQGHTSTIADSKLEHQPLETVQTRFSFDEEDFNYGPTVSVNKAQGRTATPIIDLAIAGFGKDSLSAVSVPELDFDDVTWPFSPSWVNNSPESIVPSADEYTNPLLNEEDILSLPPTKGISRSGRKRTCDDKSPI